MRSATLERNDPPAEELLDQAAARLFRVLGDPTRLRILELISQGERNVSELVELTGAPQNRVSSHLACLKWCALAEVRREGRFAFYRATEPMVGDLIRAGRASSVERAEHLASCQRIGPDWV